MKGYLACFFFCFQGIYGMQWEKDYLRLISAKSITMEMSEDPLMLQDILRIIPHLLEISHIPRESIRMTITWLNWCVTQLNILKGRIVEECFLVL